MKKISKKSILIGLCSVIGLTLLAGIALSGEMVTIEGIVNDNYQIVTDDGVVYDIAENEKGYELAQLINSRVRVYGTLEEYDDIKEITVESYEVMT